MVSSSETRSLQTFVLPECHWRCSFLQAWRQLTVSASAAACKPELSMSYDQSAYHRQREQHCREMAQSATDPDVRRRHEELADLHASRTFEDFDSQP